MMTERAVFLRHPRPHVADGTCYGRLDLDIHADGTGQIERALQLTPPLDAIIASPALRCRELALALARREGLDPVFDERLWEMHMGDWEGIPWRAIDRAASDHWLADPVERACPGGESFSQLQQRVREAVEHHLAAAGHARTIGFVCHAGPIRAMQMAWTGLSFREVFAATPAYAEPIEIVRAA